MLVTVTRVALLDREPIIYTTTGKIYRIDRDAWLQLGRPLGTIPWTELAVNPANEMEV